MRRRPSLRTAAFCLALALAHLPGEADPIKYPETRRVDHVDTYHGVQVPDPYRWLEADVRESAEVRAWVEAQNRVTSQYLEAIPEREAIRERLTELSSFARRSVPMKAGNHYFFFANNGQQELEVLHVQRSLLEEPEVLLDPNGWSKDGTVNLGGFFPSRDGRYVAYGVTEAGSDWEVYRVMELATRRVLPDEIRWVKFCCAAWTWDGEGFFYPRFPEPEKGTEYQGSARNQKLYYHRIGTPQSEDRLVLERPDQPDWRFNPRTTEDGRYLLVNIFKKGKVSEILVRDLAQPDGSFRSFLVDFPNQYFGFVGNDGPVFYFQTDFEAPRGRVLAIDIENPAQESWKEILPQSANTLRGVDLVGNLFAARYLEDAVARVRLFTLGGKHVRDLEIPGIGTLGGVQGHRLDNNLFFGYTSFNRPVSIWRHDLISGTTTLVFEPRLPSFDPDDFEVRQIFYTSKDGTRVPLFLAHRKGLRLDGNNPTILQGYGGFNLITAPSFSSSWVTWMERGGVVALACLRGGGEYGEEWHKAGTKLKKQNVFDDFIAAAEWLIANRYTRPERLAIKGGSNGGLLVGAAMIQRPDLFGVALPAVGVMDMLRFHRFTVGASWVNDYGSSDDPEQFKALYAYSPYHNLKDGARYPATLVTTADTDDRVVPAHSFKFAARLQEAHAGETPVLIKITTRAGHGGAEARTRAIEESADELAFTLKNLGVSGRAETRPASAARP
ncbi:MAG TPA: prolyl oligopeptidase family serine peptidase [Thermoanaerobaculia bacterium]|nr:prolyl oligopeptidase family serine peptidase [Thermoanaerobaculia bacterium]